MGAALSSAWSTPTSINNGGNITQQSLTINMVTEKSNKSSEAMSGQDAAGVALFLFLVFATLASFFREVILDALTFCVVALTVFCMGSLIRVATSRSYSGIMWGIYIILTMVFSLVIFICIAMARNPPISPENFIYMQEIVRELGITSLGGYFTRRDFGWIAFHNIGIGLILMLLWRAIASQFHLLVAGSYFSAGREQLPWLARATMRYRTPFKNIIILAVGSVLSASLVSGFAFEFTVNDLPRIVNSINDRILYGKPS